MKDRLVEVILPIPSDRLFTYKLNDSLPYPKKGTRLVVPLGKGNSTVIGISTGASPETLIDGIEIKDVIKVLDEEPLLNQKVIELIEWASRYYCYPLGLTYEEVLPSTIFSSRKKGISKIISKTKRSSRTEIDFLKWEDKEISLTEEQVYCIESIKSYLLRGVFSTFLLYGVTGSGKTEVYIELARICLGLGKSVLVLVPEISLTSQIVARFSSKFDDINVYHSGLSDGYRFHTWLKALKNPPGIFIGTRSCVWLPIERLGLIIVDEEHDTSYKQEHGLRYNARDVAIMRGKIEGIPVLLGSATPSLVSFYNSLKQKYRLFKLSKRIGRHGFPQVKIVDMRDRRNLEKGLPTWLSREMYNEISETLSRNEQVLLFLNKRGYARYVYCKDCGYVFMCENCSVTYIWHKQIAGQRKGGEGSLRCHYCGQERESLPLCPKCNSFTIKARGYGTQRIVSDLLRLFQGVKIERLDRDSVTSRKRLDGIIDGFTRGDVNILVGTQMVTKGYDFPNLTLVCVVMADFSFNIPEYNAVEKAFQLISQVSGRSGRGEKPGKVLIQTFMPENPFIKLAINQDYINFYQSEIVLRKKFNYPPFTRLALILISGTKESSVRIISNELMEDLTRTIKSQGFEGKIEVLGPAPSPIEKLDKKYRFQILIKAKDTKTFVNYLNQIRPIIYETKEGSVRIEIDVDPVSML